MNRAAYFRSLYWAVLYLPFLCFAQPGFQDKVEHYADFCYGVVGITRVSMEQAFGRDNRACYVGANTLTTKHNDIVLDPAYHVPGKKNFLKKCDAPAWLPSAGPSQCYDATYITTLSFPGF